MTSTMDDDPDDLRIRDCIERLTRAAARMREGCDGLDVHEIAEGLSSIETTIEMLEMLLVGSEDGA